jgi:hypothetical protein
VHPVLVELPVQEIDTALIMNAIKPIWTEKPDTASRVRGRIEAILDWATPGRAPKPGPKGAKRASPISLGRPP